MPSDNRDRIPDDARIGRRALLRAGGASLATLGGLSLPGRLIAADARNGTPPASAHSVILLYLFGGPSHIDTFDMKPAAPAEVRGEFRPIATTVPGLHICEHLPRLARWMHRATLIRSVTHTFDSHNPYAILTGYVGASDRENLEKNRDAPIVQFAQPRPDR